MNFCSNCGYNLENDARFCQMCGANHQQINQPIKMSPPPPAAPTNTNPGEGNAVAALVCGVIGVVSSMFIVGIVGLCLAISSDRKQKAANLPTLTYAKIGKILGVVSIIIGFFYIAFIVFWIIMFVTQIGWVDVWEEPVNYVTEGIFKI
jgi:hypothetical protein